jgi:hypothetical protein
LIELERRSEGLAKFVEYGDFARFALFSPNRGGATAFDTAKILSRSHMRP